MRNSTEVAEYIQKLLDQKDMKPTELANRIGVDRSTVSRYLKGTRKINMDDIPKIAAALGVSHLDILLDKSEIPDNLKPASPNTVLIPILGTIACGDPILAEENIKGYREEPKDKLPSGTLYYLEAKGDSMEPVIPNGSHVLIREQPEVEYGEIAAVLLNGDTEATLKKVTRQGNTVLLVPINREHEPIVVTEENPARIIGKAVEVKYKL
ncbi:LexA family protein [Sporosarcina contaminans]|uniref:LexA family protein n=1 Tax=Sporosarcina contaminans TaxID=633403 RepID=A0ABW3TV48_9BACL